MKKHEFLEHTADIKFRAYGKSLEEAFENAASAFSTYIGKGNKIKSRKKKSIKIEGEDNVNLLYKFLDELIYLMDAEQFIVASAKVNIQNSILNGELEGDDCKNYGDLDNVKAATYAEMYVERKKSGWEVQVVLDV